MTKEECIGKYPIVCNNDGTRLFLDRNDALKAMDKWGEQQCIAFANFIAQHNYKPHDIDTWNEGTKNTHEVYDDFIEYQRIEQQNKP